MRYGRSGHGGGCGVASGHREGSAVHNCNFSDDDSEDDDPYYEDTGVDGDVDGEDFDQ